MKLDATARMNLMKFVCSFPWTDLRVTQRERDLVMRIVGRLGLSNEEADQVAAWLEVPPPADEIDPSLVPREPRELFLAAAELTAHADGQVVPIEREQLEVFRELLRD
jgi:hypothetical protein